MAPLSPSDWRDQGWCDPLPSPCTDRLIAAFIARQERERSRGRAGRFLVCKPMGGIGNYIAGLLSCFAVALATDRALLIAPPPLTPPEKTTRYDTPVGALFAFPVDLSLAPLGVQDVPFRVDPATGRPLDTPEAQMLDLRTADLLCVNLSAALTAPLAVMPAHLWLGALPRNAAHGDVFGPPHFAPDVYGGVPFAAAVGSWLLRPRADALARQLGVAQDAVEELRRKEQRMKRYVATPPRARVLPEQ